MQTYMDKSMHLIGDSMITDVDELFKPAFNNRVKAHPLRGADVGRVIRHVRDLAVHTCKPTFASKLQTKLHFPIYTPLAVLRTNACLHVPLRNVDIVMLMAGTNKVSLKLSVGRQVTTVLAFKKQYSTLLETVRVKYPNAHIIVHDFFLRFDSGRWQYELSHTEMATRTLQFHQTLQDLCTNCDKICFSSSHARSLADNRRYIA